MKLPDEVWDTFLQMNARYPHKNPNGPSDDPWRREQMKKAVSTIRARHGGRYVCKTEHRTGWSSQSGDALGFVPVETPVHGQKMSMYIWDLVNGTTHLPNRPSDSEPLREAYVLIPETKDWLLEEPQEPEPDPGPIPTEPKLDDIISLIEATRNDLINLIDATRDDLNKEIINLQTLGARLSSQLQVIIDRPLTDIEWPTYESNRISLIGTITLKPKR